MDPISIACAVGAATKTVSSAIIRIHVFFGDVKEVDDTIQGLLAELTGLESSLDAIKHGLCDPALSKTENIAEKQRSNPVFKALKGNLDSCQATLDRFNSTVNGLNTAGTSIASRAGRQVRLDWNKDQIATWRSQLQTHTGALNLALQMIILLATCLAPNVVIAELAPRIDSVLTRMDQLSSTVVRGGRQVSSNSPTKAGSTTLQGSDGSTVEANEQIEHLKKSARTLITSARSVVTQSEAGGSVLGEQDRQSQSRTTRWLDESQSTRRAIAPRLAQVEERETPPTPAITEDLDDSDMECESLEVTLVEHFLVTGREKFDEEDYTEARTYLMKGIEEAKSLPDHKRNDPDIQSSELTLAACFFRLGELDEAKSRLLVPASQQGSSQYPPHVFRAQHLLAQVLFQQGHLVEAEARCKQALKGRHQLKKDSPHAFHESAALISDILAAQGKTHEAEVYQKLIPSSVRPRLAGNRRMSPACLSATLMASPIVMPSSPRPSDPGVPHQDTPAFTQRPMSESEASIGIISNSTALTVPDSEVASTLSSTLFSGRPPKPSMPECPIRSISSPAKVVPTAPLHPPKKKWYDRKKNRSATVSIRELTSARILTTTSMPTNTASSQFCPSAALIQSTNNPDLGLKLTTIPRGLTSTESYKTCRTKHCHFRSPLKLMANESDRACNNTLELQNNDFGVRYKWTFLAASHLPQAKDAEARYRCLVCAAEGSEDSDVERSEGELVAHVYLDHSANASLEVQRRTRCVFGRLLDGRDWDVHVPVIRRQMFVAS